MYRDAPDGAGLGSGLGSGLGLGLGGGSAPAGPAQRSDTVGITGADYDAFERTATSSLSGMLSGTLRSPSMSSENAISRVLTLSSVRTRKA